MAERLTEKRVADARPRETEWTLWDSTVPGLGLRVREGGKKVYVLKANLRSRRQVKFTIGSARKINLLTARRIAKKRLGQIAEGLDPRDEDRRQRAQVSLERFYVDVYLPHARLRLRPRTLANIRSAWRKHIKGPFGSRLLTSITTEEVRAWHGRIALATSPTTANRILTILGGVFHVADELGTFTRESPTRRVKKFPETPRVVAPDDLKLQRLIGAIESIRDAPGLDGRASNLFMSLLLSGLRRDELRTLRWVDVDPHNASLSLRRPKTVPRIVGVSRRVVDLLLGLPRVGSLVFESYSHPGVPATFAAEWKAVYDAAEIEGLRLHDARHFFASYSVRAGGSVLETGRLLGQRSSKVTEGYAESADPDLRAVAEAAAERIMDSRFAK